MVPALLRTVIRLLLICYYSQGCCCSCRPFTSNAHSWTTSGQTIRFRMILLSLLILFCLRCGYCLRELVGPERTRASYQPRMTAHAQYKLSSLWAQGMRRLAASWQDLRSKSCKKSLYQISLVLGKTVRCQKRKDHKLLSYHSS